MTPGELIEQAREDAGEYDDGDLVPVDAGELRALAGALEASLKERDEVRAALDCSLSETTPERARTIFERMTRLDQILDTGPLSILQEARPASAQERSVQVSELGVIARFLEHEGFQGEAVLVRTVTDGLTKIDNVLTKIEAER